MEKVIYHEEQGEHHSCWSTANTSYERHRKRQKNCLQKHLKEKTDLCNWWYEFSCWMIFWKKRNNGLVFSGFKALPCFYNSSLNLPSQMGGRMWHYTVQLSLIEERWFGNSLRGRSCFRGLMRNPGLNLSPFGSKSAHYIGKIECSLSPEALSKSAAQCKVAV